MTPVFRSLLENIFVKNCKGQNNQYDYKIYVLQWIPYNQFLRKTNQAMYRYKQYSLRQGRVSYWDNITLGFLATHYRRAGLTGSCVSYRMVKHWPKRAKEVKIYSNITKYPRCEGFLYKASPRLGE